MNLAVFLENGGAGTIYINSSWVEEINFDSFSPFSRKTADFFLLFTPAPSYGPLLFFTLRFVVLVSVQKCLRRLLHHLGQWFAETSEFTI